MAEGNGLLNRPVGINPPRGFESRPLRFSAKIGAFRIGFSSSVFVAGSISPLGSEKSGSVSSAFGVWPARK